MLCSPSEALSQLPQTGKMLGRTLLTDLGPMSTLAKSLRSSGSTALAGIHLLLPLRSPEGSNGDSTTALLHPFSSSVKLKPVSGISCRLGVSWGIHDFPALKSTEGEGLRFDIKLSRPGRTKPFRLSRTAVGCRPSISRDRDMAKTEIGHGFCLPSQPAGGSTRFKRLSNNRFPCFKSLASRLVVLSLIGLFFQPMTR